MRKTRAAIIAAGVLIFLSLSMSSKAQVFDVAQLDGRWVNDRSGESVTVLAEKRFTHTSNGGDGGISNVREKGANILLTGDSYNCWYLVNLISGERATWLLKAAEGKCPGSGMFSRGE